MRAKWLILGTMLMAVAGCGLFDGWGKGRKTVPSADLGAGDAAAGQVIFESYCVACHGPGGQGDGPLAADLPVAPANLTLLAQGNGGVFPAERAMTQVYGYPGRYHRGLMPEFGPLLEGPVVEWTTPAGEATVTPKALLDLAVYLESLQA